MEEKVYSVYCHTNKINGKKYVGMTKRGEYRWNKNGQGYNSKGTAIYEAIQEYGWENFEHEFLYTNLTKEEACALEQETIKELNALYPNGYNIESGGINYKMHPRTKDKLRKIHYGVKPSSEARKKMSISQTGRKHSEASKLLMSAKKKAAYELNPVSKETKRKMSEAKKQLDLKRKEEGYEYREQKENAAKQRRAVNQYDKDWNFIATYEYIRKAAEQHDIPPCHITRACRQPRRTAGGYRWKYADETAEPKKELGGDANAAKL